MKRAKKRILASLVWLSLVPATVCAQLTIEECYRAAHENYPLVMQLELVERTEAFTLENAARGYLPQLGLSAKATYQSDVTKLPFAIPGVEFGLERDQYQVVAELNQPIWDGGNMRYKRQEARADAAVRKQQVEVSLYSLRERVNQLYFGMLLLRAQLEQNALLQAQLGRNFKQVEACVAQGVAGSADLDAVRVEQLDAAQREADLQSSLQAYAEALALLTGKKVDAQTPLAKPLADGIRDDVSLRPELSLYARQRELLDVYEKRLDVALMPRLGLFAQGGYGDPGLNMLKGGFEPYYIAGIRLGWDIGGWYTRRADKRLLDTRRADIDAQEEAFLLNRQMEETGYRRTVEKLDAQMKRDDELVRLRERIRRAAEAKVAEGTLTVAEMLREVTAEDQARQDKAIHEIQRLQALYDIKHSLNH